MEKRTRSRREPRASKKERRERRSKRKPKQEELRRTSFAVHKSQEREQESLDANGRSRSNAHAQKGGDEAREDHVQHHRSKPRRGNKPHRRSKPQRRSKPRRKRAVATQRPGGAGAEGLGRSTLLSTVGASAAPLHSSFVTLLFFTCGAVVVLYINFALLEAKSISHYESVTRSNIGEATRDMVDLHRIRRRRNSHPPSRVRNHHWRLRVAANAEAQTLFAVQNAKERHSSAPLPMSKDLLPASLHHAAVVAQWQEQQLSKATQTTQQVPTHAPDASSIAEELQARWAALDHGTAQQLAPQPPSQTISGLAVEQASVEHPKPDHPVVRSVSLRGAQVWRGAPAKHAPDVSFHPTTNAAPTRSKVVTATVVGEADAALAARQEAGAHTAAVVPTLWEETTAAAGDAAAEGGDRKGAVARPAGESSLFDSAMLGSSDERNGDVSTMRFGQEKGSYLSETAALPVAVATAVQSLPAPRSTRLPSVLAAAEAANYVAPPGGALPSRSLVVADAPPSTAADWDVALITGVIPVEPLSADGEELASAAGSADAAAVPRREAGDAEPVLLAATARARRRMRRRKKKLRRRRRKRPSPRLIRLEEDENEDDVEEDHAGVDANLAY